MNKEDMIEVMRVIVRESIDRKQSWDSPFWTIDHVIHYTHSPSEKSAKKWLKSVGISQCRRSLYPASKVKRAASIIADGTPSQKKRLVGC